MCAISQLTSSFLTRLVAAIVVTIPSCYYLWPSASEHGHNDHGSHDHDDSHHEEKSEEAHDDDQATDAPPEEATEDSNDQSGEKSDSAESKEPTEQEDESASDDDDESDESVQDVKHGQKGKVPGVQFKGKTAAGDSENEMTHTSKREPDAKGAFKRRLDSDSRKELGTDPSGDGNDGTEPVCTALRIRLVMLIIPQSAASKPVSSFQGDISNKQKGISTTATRHSTQIDKDPEMSKKSEGVPETAKVQGTVSVNRDAK